MAFRKALVYRFLNSSKPTTTYLSPQSSSRSSNPTSLQKILTKSSTLGESGIIRRFLHQDGSTVLKSSSSTTIPMGEKLVERLRGLNGERIRLDTISPPIPPDRKVEERAKSLTVEDVRKVLKVTQMETVKTRLRAVTQASIPYNDFVQICRGDGNDRSSFEQGLTIANDLDRSGSVLVIGNVVFLKPEMEKTDGYWVSKLEADRTDVARAIESVITLPSTTGSKSPSTTDREELQELEDQKAQIDLEATTAVRRELWFGLGFLVVQTLGFMRLTFWELSWDVMEPICFYVTSVYFMAGYAFFLRTSKDPSFEGFFESRFSAKQKRLMENKKFDVQQWMELRRAFRRSEMTMMDGRQQFFVDLDSDFCDKKSDLGTSYCGCHSSQGCRRWSAAIV